MKNRLIRSLINGRVSAKIGLSFLPPTSVGGFWCVTFVCATLGE